MKKILILQIMGCLLFSGFVLLFNAIEWFTPLRIISLYCILGICNIINATWMVLKPVEDRGIHDILTNCLNRIGLEQNKIKYEKKKQYTIIFYDINNLKKVNDIHGHDDGDIILKKAAERLNYWDLYGDIYRIGGDEFLVVLPKYVSKDNLNYLVNNFDNSPLNSDYEDEFICNFSYGIVSKDKKQKQTFEEILTEADKKMYEMKNKLKTWLI